jgi:hypothetical protein
MPHQVTVTGVVGPGRTVTAAVIPNVTEVTFVPDPKQLKLKTNDPNNANKDFDISAATTVTCTITGGNYAFVVS